MIRKLNVLQKISSNLSKLTLKISSSLRTKDLISALSILDPMRNATISIYQEEMESDSITITRLLRDHEVSKEDFDDMRNKLNSIKNVEIEFNWS